MILVTGVAGFIGFHVAAALMDRGEQVVGVDCLNEYYDVGLKRARLARLQGPGFTFVQEDVSNREGMEDLARAYGEHVTGIIHLAGQAGVRFSMKDPYAYVTANVMGHVTMLEMARRLPKLVHFVYASSSSVYGLETSMPFREDARAETPTSLYAATKRACELMSHSFAHLYALPQTGLRFFTVYGPWGRPDMAIYSFTQSISRGEPITLYGAGSLMRDFTYIDDVVAGVLGVLNAPPAGDKPRVLNIGNNRAELVSTVVALIEQELGRKAIVQDEPAPAADVAKTWADVEAIRLVCGYSPSTSLEAGIPRFVKWFRQYEADQGRALA